MALLDNLFGLLRARRKNRRSDLLQSDKQRTEAYARYLRAYRGYSVRGPLTTGLVQESRRLRFNFNRPIVNLSAAFMASKPLSWEVAGDADASAAAKAIWERSGSDLALLQAARTACIYGELGALATQNEDGEPLIEFVDPWICFPTFDGADYSKLRSLEISYERQDDDGNSILHREFYDQGTSSVFEDDTELSSGTHDQIPAAWIRNLSVTGVPDGISDLEGVIDLVEEYDHLASKQTRIVDYYAAPSIVCKGVAKGDLKKDVGSIYFLPSENADMCFLEWSGTGPDVEAQLTRIRNAIAEVSQVPAVAFGQADSGLTSISGIAIQILYGPLIAKTRDKHANWSPALQGLMEICLKAAGFDVEPGSVRVCWPDAMPVDGAERVAQATAIAAAELKSRRSLMTDLGVEDPEAELKRIITEQIILSVPAGIANPAPPDPVMVARAAGKGHAVAEARAPGVQDATPQGGTQQDRVNARPAPGEAPPPAPNVGQNIAAMLELVDEAFDAENDSLQADQDDAASGGSAAK